MKNKKIKKSNTDLDKLMVLIEKECNLYDKRTKKEKEESPHPSGTCYMNDIFACVTRIVEWHEDKKLKEFTDEVINYVRNKSALSYEDKAEVIGYVTGMKKRPK